MPKETQVVKYVEVRELQNRGAIDPAPSSEVEGTLLIGERPVLQFYGNQSSYGEDYISLFPVFHNGQRCWLRRCEWCPAEGYSASGTQDYIISFEDGIKLFLERGVFEFPQPVQ